MGEDRQALTAWFRATFVRDPERGFAMMNPPGVPSKYVRSSKSLSQELIGGAFDGLASRRRCAEFKTVPYSLAVTPETRDGYAQAAMLDIDAGGVTALKQALAVCAELGLWAFAQLGASEQHAGGHVYIPFTSLLPATMLHNLAARIQARCGVLGEAYPCGKDLRLPLQLHLRAPGGPQRFPLLLQDGSYIDAQDAWTALAGLRAAWHPNTPEQLTTALTQLPALSVKNRTPLHKSKVNPQNTTSVINWFNDNYSVYDQLSTVTTVPHGRFYVMHCPYHDDKHPSLIFWQHSSTGRVVCRCMSAHSNCPLAEAPYYDAFNLCCINENLEPGAAVKQIAERNNLGERREFKTVDDLPHTVPTVDALTLHQEIIASKRGELEEALRSAVEARGTVTALRAVPGLGKTEAATRLTNELHAQGRSVVFVAPSHDHAAHELAPRLDAPFVWQARLKLCTCYDPGELEGWAAKGYALPECVYGCPYLEQFERSRGKVIIYQHNHLHLNHGELLARADVVFIDESPIGALLEEHTATQDDLRQLGNRMRSGDEPDPALALIRALWTVGHTQKAAQRSLRGMRLRDALQEALGGTLPIADAIAAARTSFYAARHKKADGITSAENLPKLFFGKMLDALEHDMEPGQHNTLLAWDGHAWLWYEHHTMLGATLGKLTAPAVVVLDGSAHPLVCERLYRPWSVQLVDIEVPISPAVRIIQCPVLASTRKIVQDVEHLERVIRLVTVTCHDLQLLLDGGVSYLAATDRFATALGGTWLHYGNQRGINSLAQARTLAIIASPTAPPDVIERKALALWADDAPIDCTWERIGPGDYQASDPRLQAANDLHGAEELRQAAHRCRPILSTTPTTLLIFSPWKLAPLGLTPHTTITELPHGNSSHVEAACARYLVMRSARDTARQRAGQADRTQTLRAGAHHFEQIQNGVKEAPINLNRIENRQSDASPLSASACMWGTRVGSGLAPDDPWVLHNLRLAEEKQRAGDSDGAARYRRLVEGFIERLEVSA
jgi:hypothetical protein